MHVLEYYYRREREREMYREREREREREIWRGRGRGREIISAYVVKEVRDGWMDVALVSVARRASRTRILIAAS